MWSAFKFKKNAINISMAIVPMLVFIMMFFSFGIETVNFEGILLVSFNFINTLISLLSAFLVGVVIMLFGNRLLNHPFIKMLEGKGLISFTLDSTGIIAPFNAVVNAPEVKGSIPGARDLDDTYDTDMMYRLLLPQDAPLTTGYILEKDEKGNIVPGKPKRVLVLPDEEKKYDKLFSFESRPAFIFNKVSGKLLSRDALAVLEKDIMLKHNSLNILRKLQNISDDFKLFGRYIGEQLHPKPKGLFANNPLIKWVIIGAVICLIIFIIILFVPGFLQAAGSISRP